ncbi:MAG: DUF4349 domain-containing protein [Bacteroidia bacterium]
MNARFTALATPAFAGILLLAACANSENQSLAKKADQSAVSESPNGGEEKNQPLDEPELKTDQNKLELSSTAAANNPNDTLHEFIRTADIRCRVGDVREATYAIENIVRHFGGFVTFTHLSSTVESQQTIPFSSDSAMEHKRYSVGNTMAIRVPNAYLDTTLKCIAPLMEYIDHRTIEANDVHLDKLTNKLAKQRQERYSALIDKEATASGSKLDQKVSAHTSALAAQEHADQSLLSNLRLQDQLDYSTVRMYVYQQPVVAHTPIELEKTAAAYTPSFTTEFAGAMQTGWSILKAIILFFVRLWPLVLLGIAGFFTIRYFMRRGAQSSI